MKRLKNGNKKLEACSIPGVEKVCARHLDGPPDAAGACSAASTLNNPKLTRHSVQGTTSQEKEAALP